VTRANMSRILLAEEGQVLRVTYVTKEDEGVYECRAKNQVGMVKATGLVQLKSSADRDVLYENISIPVIIAVVIAILTVVLLVVIAKLCYSRHGKSRVWKAPPTPPTPRLTQYELPQEEDDDCTMTLNSVTRDGSTASQTDPCSGVGGGRGSVLGVGSASPVICGSVMSGYAPYMPPPPPPNQYMTTSYNCGHNVPHSHTPCQAPLHPNCALCDFPMQTMPIHTMTLKRYQPNGNGNAIYNDTHTMRPHHQQQPMIEELPPRSHSVSPPRMSAEF